MSSGEVCCILGVCCPPGGAAQREHLIALVQKARPQLSNEAAAAAADRVLAAHDAFRGVAAAIDAGQ